MEKKLLFAIGLQVAIILIMVTLKLIVISSGTEVMLEIAPVDPRDVLRGDYVTFQYEISNVYNYYGNTDKIYNGDEVYVTLNRSGQYWEARKVSKKKPVDDSIFIKGWVERGGIEGQGSQFGNSLRNRPTNSELHIVYGIEQYYIPEGKGANFRFNNKDAGALVAIDDNGKAVLKRLYIDAKPWP